MNEDGIVLGFKVRNPSKEKSIKNTVQNALKQIIVKKYVTNLESKGIPADRIRIYGFAFEGKNVLIDGGYFSEYGNDFDPEASAKPVTVKGDAVKQVNSF